MEGKSRRFVRLAGYDYGWPGAYFLTIVSFQRALLFESEAAQEIVRSLWEELPARYPEVALDSFVVMPNHVHGVVFVRPGTDIVGAVHEPPVVPTGQDRRRRVLPKAVGYLKMQSAKRINAWRGMPGVPVWQRDYFEHVVRGGEDLVRIQKYIEENPLKRVEDELNPGRG